jgi:hypothetical protein
LRASRTAGRLPADQNDFGSGEAEIDSRVSLLI